jgi:hypothetical protein
MADLPEQQARQTIDAMLAAAGWAVQDYKAFDPSASIGIAVREVPLKSGRCDYLLLVNPKPLGVVEAKKEGVTLSTVEGHAAIHLKIPLPSLVKQTRIVAEVERRGGTESRHHHQTPTRQPPAAVHPSKSLHR